MNKVLMCGRLTRDPETRVSTTTISKFSIAVDRRFKREGQPDTDFFNVTTFGKTAEFVEKYLHKGTKVIVVGSLQNDNYTNKDGQTVYNVQIVADEVEFAESKKNEEGSLVKGNDFVNVPDSVVEELPFN